MHCENSQNKQDHKGKSHNNAYQKKKKKVLQLIPEKKDNYSVWKQEEQAFKPIINLNDFPVLDCAKNNKNKPKKEKNKSTFQNFELSCNCENDKKNIQNEALPSKSSQISQEMHENDEQGHKIVQESLETLLRNVSAIAEKTENKKFFSNIKDIEKLREVAPTHCYASKKIYKNYKKKRAEPVILNLEEALDANKAQLKIKSTKGQKRKSQKCFDNKLLSGNTLDSANPIRTRGKQREVKKPKITNLKKCIIKERILKEKFKEKSLGSFSMEKAKDLINNVDFKIEIKEYLNKLEKNKIAKTIEKNLKGSKTQKKRIIAGNTKFSDEVADIPEETTKKLVSPSIKVTTTVPKIIQFSSKMRDYCDNMATPALNTAVAEMIKELINLQDRAFSRNPIKAKARKRHVSGMKEVKKYLTMKKVKMIVISPNLEKLQMKGSVYELVNELKTLAKSQNVPCVFALDRYKLGRCTRKNVPISAFAVLNYEGVEDRFQSVLQHLEDAKNQLTEMKENLKVKAHEEEKNNINAPLTTSLMSAFKEVLSLSKANIENDSLEINDKEKINCYETVKDVSTSSAQS